MNKNFMKVTFVVAYTAIIGYSVYSNQSTESMSELMLANVEALATPEQPNVNDCIYDPNYYCEALHPTDPTQDKKRFEARW